LKPGEISKKVLLRSSLNYLITLQHPGIFLKRHNPLRDFCYFYNSFHWLIVVSIPGNRRAKSIVGAILLVIFSGYYISITFFPHTHIVEGITIVHSHPYKSTPDNSPTPLKHSKSALILIQFLSALQIITALVVSGIFIFRQLSPIIKLTHREACYFTPYTLASHRPRAPTA